MNTKRETAQNEFVAKTFGWMFLGLMITAITSILVMDNPSIMDALVDNTDEGMEISGIMILLMIVEFGMVFVLCMCLNKMNAFVAMTMFLVYALFNGITISPMVFSYTAASAASAFLVTSLLFGVMAVWGHVTKKDLTGIGSLCFMALIGLIIAMVVNIFMQNSMMDFVISCCAVVIFLGLTAFDAQKIKEMGRTVSYGTDEGKKMAIMGALALYLDFLNLFLHLLSLMGNSKD